MNVYVKVKTDARKSIAKYDMRSYCSCVGTHNTTFKYITLLRYWRKLK